MKITIDVEVNYALKQALRRVLTGIEVSVPLEDRKRVTDLINELDSKKPEEWCPELKRELAHLLMLRACFKYSDGESARDWESRPWLGLRD